MAYFDLLEVKTSMQHGDVTRILRDLLDCTQYIWDIRGTNKVQLCQGISAYITVYS